MAKQKKRRKGMRFVLRDGGQDRGPDIEGIVTVHGHALDIYLEGYGTNDTEDGYGSPICLDYFDGVLQVLVWGDINDESPTSTIGMAGAKLASRLFDAVDVEAAWKEFVRNHILPSRLFAIAMGVVNQTDKDAEHLKQCKACSIALLAYKEAK